MVEPLIFSVSHVVAHEFMKPEISEMWETVALPSNSRPNASFKLLTVVYGLSFSLVRQSICCKSSLAGFGFNYGQNWSLPFYTEWNFLICLLGRVNLLSIISNGQFLKVSSDLVFSMESMGNKSSFQLKIWCLLACIRSQDDNKFLSCFFSLMICSLNAYVGFLIFILVFWDNSVV